MEANILQARAEFNKVIDFVTGEALGREIDVVEGELFRMLLRLGRQLMELFIRSVGTGNSGQTVTTAEGSVMQYRRDAPRRYLSIFGVITIEMELFSTIDDFIRLSPGVICYDTTNFYTYFQEPKRSEMKTPLV